MASSTTGLAAISYSTALTTASSSGESRSMPGSSSSRSSPTTSSPQSLFPCTPNPAKSITPARCSMKFPTKISSLSTPCSLPILHMTSTPKPLGSSRPWHHSNPPHHPIKDSIAHLPRMANQKLYIWHTLPTKLGISMSQGHIPKSDWLSSPGLHLAINACAAAAFAASLGVPLYQVGESLSRFEPVHMRSELEIAENGIRIINDVYNANPTSMRAAIDLLKAMDCRGKRVAILGDMLEPGATDAEAHKIVLNMCCDASFGLIACVGKRFHLAAENLNLLGNDNVMCAVDSKSITLKVRERLAAVDVVLVKGSRAMQMERVADAIKDISI